MSLIKKYYPDLVNIDNTIKVTREDFLGVLAKLVLETDVYIKTLGHADSVLGQLVHKIQEGEVLDVTGTVRRIKLGNYSAKKGKGTEPTDQ